MKTNIPKLYKPVKISFSSLRMKLSRNMSVMFDCDEIIERNVMRVLTENNSWKFQILSFNKFRDDLIEIDQEALNDEGPFIDFKLIKDKVAK